MSSLFSLKNRDLYSKSTYCLQSVSPSSNSVSLPPICSGNLVSQPTHFDLTTLSSTRSVSPVSPLSHSDLTTLSDSRSASSGSLNFNAPTDAQICTAKRLSVPVESCNANGVYVARSPVVMAVILQHLSVNSADELTPGMLSGIRGGLSFYQKISCIADFDFDGLVNVTSLDLSGNLIQNVSSFAFSGLNRLKYLDLSMNLIEYFPSDVLYQVPHLRYLNVSLNKISKILPATFSRSSSLCELDISCNQLEYFISPMLSGLTSLEKLDASKNPILSIEADSFESLSSLVELDLSQCQIRFLRKLSFNGLSSLKRLLLFKNNIRSIDSNSFSSMSNLVELDLSWNDIPFLSDDTFSFFKKLQILNLSMNRFTHISSSLLSTLFPLKKLFLHGNQICSVSVDYLDSIPHLEELTLYDNPLTLSVDFLLKFNDHPTSTRLYYAAMSSLGIVDVSVSNALIPLSELQTLFLHGSSQYDSLHYIDPTVPSDLLTRFLDSLGKDPYLNYSSSQLFFLMAYAKGKGYGQLIKETQFSAANEMGVRAGQCNEKGVFVDRSFELKMNLLSQLQLDSWSCVTPSHLAEFKQPILLSDLQIFSLHSKDLLGFSAITVLDLSHNYISSVPNGFFKSVPHLSTLRLEGNELRRFAETHLNDLTELTHLSLYENPLTLDVRFFQTLCSFDPSFKFYFSSQKFCESNQSVLVQIEGHVISIYDLLDLFQVKFNGSEYYLLPNSLSLPQNKALTEIQQFFLLRFSAFKDLVSNFDANTTDSVSSLEVADASHSVDDFSNSLNSQSSLSSADSVSKTSSSSTSLDSNSPSPLHSTHSSTLTQDLPSAIPVFKDSYKNMICSFSLVDREKLWKQYKENTSATPEQQVTALLSIAQLDVKCNDRIALRHTIQKATEVAKLSRDSRALNVRITRAKWNLQSRIQSNHK